MATLEGKSKEVLEKTEWVAIVTWSDKGSHLVGTWGDYVRALRRNDETVIIPAGDYWKTEENLKKNNRVQLLVASKTVQRKSGMGQGCRISGTGEIQTTTEIAEKAKSKFSWARGALVVTVEKIELLL